MEPEGDCSISLATAAAWSLLLSEPCDHVVQCLWSCPNFKDGRPANKRFGRVGSAGVDGSTCLLASVPLHFLLQLLLPLLWDPLQNLSLVNLRLHTQTHRHREYYYTLSELHIDIVWNTERKVKGQLLSPTDMIDGEGRRAEEMESGTSTHASRWRMPNANKALLLYSQLVYT